MYSEWFVCVPLFVRGTAAAVVYVVETVAAVVHVVECFITFCIPIQSISLSKRFVPELLNYLTSVVGCFIPPDGGKSGMTIMVD